LPPEHTLFFLTQFYNVKCVEKKNLFNLVFGSKMGTHRNEWEKLNKTPGDSKVASSLGFGSKNLLE